MGAPSTSLSTTPPPGLAASLTAPEDGLCRCAYQGGVANLSGQWLDSGPGDVAAGLAVCHRVYPASSRIPDGR